MKTKIFLEKIKIYAYHGVLPEERQIGTYYYIDAELHTDFAKATQTDNLEDTISYADINEIIHQEMKIPSQLLERVAGRILERIEREFPKVEYLKLKITKTAPPMQGEVQGAAVEIEKNLIK